MNSKNQKISCQNHYGKHILLCQILKDGIIILGVKENKKDDEYTIEGIDNVKNILQDFWNTINNTQKISFNTLTDDNVELNQIENKHIIIIRIPRANRKNQPIFINENPLTGSYKRYHEGDYRCSKEEVRKMIIESAEESKDSVVLEEYNIKNVNKETLANYRKTFEVNKGKSHKWNLVDDEEFLYLINALDKKSKNLTLAGLLMFGNKEDILSIVPTFYLDYREIREIHNPTVRWENRITSMDDNLIGNIWDFFQKIVDRLISDIDTPFALNEKMMRIDNTPVHESVREALVNSLIHFQIDESGNIVIEKGEKYFKFSNPGNMRIPIEEAFRGGESDPRNPILHQMFSYLGYGERAGSGLFNIKATWKEKEWKSPIIEERLNPNRTTLLLNMEKDLQGTDEFLVNFPKKFLENEQKILDIIKEKPNITQVELSNLVKITPRAVRKIIKKLKENKIIERVGSDRKGYWKILITL